MQTTLEEIFETLDGLPLWQAQLVWDYGYARAMRTVRQQPTPARAREALEEERKENERLRWLVYNGHLPSV